MKVPGDHPHMIPIFPTSCAVCIPLLNSTQLVLPRMPMLCQQELLYHAGTIPSSAYTPYLCQGFCLTLFSYLIEETMLGRASISSSGSYRQAFIGM